MNHKYRRRRCHPERAPVHPEARAAVDTELTIHRDALLSHIAELRIERDRLRTACSAKMTGDSHLDLCCGAGASALAAARVVGGSGHVVAVDLSPHPEPADAVRDAVLGELRRRNV